MVTAEFIPHNKTSISKVTVTPISITRKSCDLEFLAFPAPIYSNPVDSNGSLHHLMPSQKQRHCHQNSSYAILRWFHYHGV